MYTQCSPNNIPIFMKIFLQSNSNRIFPFCNLIKQAVALWEILTLNRDLFLPLYCLTKNEGYIFLLYATPYNQASVAIRPNISNMIFEMISEMHY